MSIQLQMEEMPDYLAARFTGAGAIEEAWRQFEMIGEQCKRANKNNFFSISRRAKRKHLSWIDSS